MSTLPRRPGQYGYLPEHLRREPVRIPIRCVFTLEPELPAGVIGGDQDPSGVDSLPVSEGGSSSRTPSAPDELP